MRKKLFTLKELYDYVKTGHSFQYSARDESEELKVLMDSKLLFVNSDDSDDTEGLLPVELWSCHLGENLNGSSIPEKAGKKALPSFSNRPILGYIHEVNGQPEFYGHNIEEGEDGEIIYHEIPVGVVPESNGAHFEEKDGKTYIVVKGYIYAEYSKAAEILEREGECACSVELSVREFTYDAKQKVIVLNDFYFSGVTILGKDDNGKNVKPGMQGANIKIAQFEMGEEITLIDVLEKLNETLSRFNDNQAGKEELKVTLFEELLTQYGKTVEDVTFEYEGLSDDELRAAFEEAFGEKKVETEEATTEEDTIESEVKPEDFESESEVTEDKTEETEEETEEVENESDETEVVQESLEEHFVEFTAKINGQIRTFSVSLNDKLEAIYALVNATYGELDDDFYDVVVYEDTKTVEMHGFFRGKNYRQTYKVRNNEYQLVGDRVEIFCKWMTEDELNQFENIKSNYAALEQFKADKEAEVARKEKMALISTEDYVIIQDTAEFKSLVQNIDTFSKDEVIKEADAILGKFARKGANFNFAQQPNKHFFGFTNNETGKSNAPVYANFFD